MRQGNGGLPNARVQRSRVATRAAGGQRSAKGDGSPRERTQADAGTPDRGITWNEAYQHAADERPTGHA